MQQQYRYLLDLLDQLPQQISARSSSDLNLVLKKFVEVLDYINGSSDTLKRATSVYYNDISSIRDNLQQSLFATDAAEKDVAFMHAKEALKNNIEALLTLIQPEETLMEA